MQLPRLPHWLFLTVILSGIGTSLLWYKIDTLGFPLQPDQESQAWTIQARLEIDAGGGPLKVEMRLPENTPRFVRQNETYVSREFGLTVESKQQSRTATWARRRARGTNNLYYRATFARDQSTDQLPEKPAYPRVPDLPEPFNTALNTLVDDVREHSADIGSFTAEMLRRINDRDPSNEMRLFLTTPDYQEYPTQLAQTLLAGARIPSIQLNGVVLNSITQQASVIPWLAIHNEQKWLFYDPNSGEEYLPDDYLVWWVGTDPIATVTGGALEASQISIRRDLISNLELATERAESRGSRLIEFSPLGLPVHTQSLFQMLLMIPLGALLVVILRNVIGLRSFGTFMPILIALAFRETQLLAGIILFLTVVGIGLLLRFYLERLRLLLVPRLSAVLTIVVILLILVGIISYRLNIEVGLSVALFPMVIIAMVIERMSITWEERGPRDALIDGAGSLVIAIMGYLVMEQEVLRHLMLVFPELLLIVLALIIALGRYTGYRVSELWRFKALRESTSVTTPPTPDNNQD